MRKYPWDTWRIVMLIGALMQLGVALIRMNSDGDAEGWLTVVSWVGYGMLAAGFMLAMRKRSELKEQRRQAEARAESSSSSSEAS